MIFTYTVAAGDTSSDLDYSSTTALALNNGTIVDADSTSAYLTLAAKGAANSLGANKELVIDGVVPTVSSVTATAADGTYTMDDQIAITVIFSEAVIVTGTPKLTLETGVADELVDYSSGSGGTTLTFIYTVDSDDNTIDLDYGSPGALALNNATISDAAGNAATLTLASPGSENSLGANKALLVNGSIPTIVSVSTSAGDGYYVAGDTLAFTVNFSEAVTVTGTPQLTLETGATDAVATYTSGSASSALVFRYVVTSGDNSNDLDYVSDSALTFNSGAIIDAAGSSADLTLAVPGAANSISSSKSLVIDNIAPIFSSVTEGSAISTSGNDVDYQNIADTLIISWSGSDGGSGISNYEYALGTTTGATDAVPWTSADTATADTLTGLSLLTEGATYYLSVRATDVAGNISDLSLIHI